MLSAASRIAAARATWSLVQARPEQLPPAGDWLTWLILTGRGWGKTRTGAEETIWQAHRTPRARLAVVGRTWPDVRGTMIEGESGLLPVLERYRTLKAYDRSRGQLTLDNGSLIQGYSADRPDRLRGPQHHHGWADERAAWRYNEAWTNLRLGLRLGAHPTIIVTTTPRPSPAIRELAADPGTHTTTGHTDENAANLSPAALTEFHRLYGGTRLGRQELAGEILENTEGALWDHTLFDAHRVARPPDRPARRVVGVDPAVTASATSDETGIIVASITDDGTVYVESDRSGRYPPDQWARIIAGMSDIDAVIVEVNQGGDLVRQVLETAGVATRIIPATATRGKAARAEPVAVLYRQGRVKHAGTFPELEDQAATWVPGQGASPDRVDALVWAIAGLTGRATRPFRRFPT